jgi:hypothetical protein
MAQVSTPVAACHGLRCERAQSHDPATTGEAPQAPRGAVNERTAVIADAGTGVGASRPRMKLIGHLLAKKSLGQRRRASRAAVPSLAH